jgi:hypothetical protein
MDYDSYKLETPEEEDERLYGRYRRERARQEYLADLGDYLLQEKADRERERKHDGIND